MLLKQLRFLLINTLKFAAAFLLVYFLIVFLFCQIKLNGKPLVFRACQGMVWKGGYTYERFKEFNPSEKYDILIFGSSRANRGINPRVFDQFGYNCYNLATDDQTPLNTEVLVKQYVQSEKCRLVIIDIYDKVFAQPDLESTGDLIQNVNCNKTAAKMVVASKDIRAFNAFCVRLMMQKSPPLYAGETDLYKGFRALHIDSVSFTANYKPYKMIASYMTSLANTIKYLKSINMPFLLVSQPMVFYPRAANHNLFLNDLKVVLQENNVPFYDLTDHTNVISNRDYADECHLNVEGANKYSQYLLDNHISKIIPSDTITNSGEPESNSCLLNPQQEILFLMD